MPSIGTLTAGTPMPSRISIRSVRRNSMVLAENASSCAVIPAFASMS